MTPSQSRPRAVIFDVDGVVSPVHGPGTEWRDDVVAGHAFGPVHVSTALCARLDKFAETEHVGCWWLTSWTAEMRADMHPFPGRNWPVIAEQSDVHVGGEWWKLVAFEAWLDQHPEIRSVAWCDDHLRGGRPAAVRRRLAARGIDVLLIAPDLKLGLTPRHVEQLETWARR